MDKRMNLRILLSVAALAVMAAAADLLGEREVIFPEVAALAVGLWIADKRVWNVRGWQVPLLMTVSAVLGVLITTYAQVHVFWQLTAAFFVSAVLMTAMRIPLIPGIAAILLPVLLHTESWYYPASVCVMTSLMAAGAWLMQRCGLKSPLAPVGKNGVAARQAAKTWGSRYLLLLPWLAVAAVEGWLFAIVPPLVIILIELTNPRNMFRSRPLALWGAVVAVAAIGTLCRLLLLQSLGLPYVAAVSAAFLLAILLIRRAGLMFPPIPALAVIPFILPGSYLWFPLEAALGGAYAVAVPLIVSRVKAARAGGKRGGEM